MQLNKNKNEDYEYTGSPKRGYIVNMIFVGLFALAMFYLAYFFYKQFSAYENGATIKEDAFFFLIYKVGGRWANSILFFCIGLLFAFSSHKFYKKYQTVKDQDF